jgi:glutamate 5-kinase
MKVKKSRTVSSFPGRRWVVKAGSQMVCSGGPLLLRSWMSQVAQLKKTFGIELIWVTSGAIASAAERTNFSRKNRELPEKQALSAIGQPMVMDLYNLALNATGLLGAQVLLTAGDTQDKARRKNLQNTLEKLLEWQAVPILNENDAVATEEIRFGDNDSLSVLIAQMMNAERLVILTDVEGLYDSDPRDNPQAKLIHNKRNITENDLKKVAKSATSERGTGGMYSKLLAARNALKSGIVTHLMRGDLPQNLISLARGEQIGTEIGKAPQKRNRK